MTVGFKTFACGLAFILLGACQTTYPIHDASEDRVFKTTWRAGVDPNEPQFHIQNIDDDTFAIRQSLKTTIEAPFMYLLFGDDRALLIDTGDKGVDLRRDVDKLIEDRMLRDGLSEFGLTVMHTHGHFDHTAGDAGFEDRPNTEIVGTEPEEVAAFFKLDNWPEGAATFDLGGRVVEIFPAIGHHPSHVMVFDPDTRILFSGDTVYPGLLYFQCENLEQFNDTIDKVSAFANERDVKWLLGGHVEMKTAPGELFQGPMESRQGEHRLELPVSILADIRDALDEIAGRPVVLKKDEFVLVPHPENREGKTPPNWCLTDKQLEAE